MYWGNYITYVNMHTQNIMFAAVVEPIIEGQVGGCS